MEQDLNRLKVVLVERKRTSKWLAEELGKTMSILKTLLPATKAIVLLLEYYILRFLKQL
jgi:hypothetical protein